MNNTRIASPVLVRDNRKTVRLFLDNSCNCRINAGYQFQIEININTITEFNKRFISAMALAARCSTNNIFLDKNIADAVMASIQESGLACYNSLDDAFHQALVSYSLDSSTANIFIQSPASFPLLWEFIYAGSPSAQVDNNLFWGIRHRITRILTSVQKPQNYVENAQRFLFCQNKNLTYSSNEKRLLRQSSSANGMDFFLLDDMLEGFSDEDKNIPDKIIRTWASGNFDFIHVASHLDMPTDGLLDSKIKLTFMDNDVDLSLVRLAYLVRGDEYRFTRSPLIFLNACKTMTNPQQLFDQSFPKIFMRFGAGAVIATACDVPDVFANEFAVKYYEFLFQSRADLWDSLGEALRKTREYFLTEFNNPLGLAYGLYAQYD
jgi:hypothetical protein